MASEVAACFARIFLDENPLRNSLGNLGNLLVSPVRDAARLAQAALGRSFADIGQSWKALLHGNIGGAFENVGAALTDALSGSVRTAGNILGTVAGKAIDVVGGLAGGLTEGVIRLAGNATKAIGDLVQTGGGMMAQFVRSTSQSIGDILNFIPIVGPVLGGAVKVVGSGLAAGVQLVGNVIGGALSIVGGFVTKIGDFVGGAIESITRLASSAARTIIPLAGGILAGIIDAVGHGASGAIGGVINAVTNPVKQALSRDLFNLNQSVLELLGMQAGMAKFGAIFQAMGAATGFSKNQMDQLIQSVAEFSNRGVGEITQAAQALLQFSERLQGQQFKQALELSPQLAAIFGGDAAAAARELGHALSDPERGLHMLNRELQLFTKPEMQFIENLYQGGKAAEAQQAILDKLAGRVGNLVGAMSATTEGKLQALNRTWSNIARAIAAPLMPLVDIATDIASAVVNALGGSAKPILSDLKAMTEDWAKSIRGFLEENKGTFQEWGSLVKSIVGNVWELLKQGTGKLLNLDMGQAKDYWDAFKSGLTDALKWLENATSSWEGFQDAADEAWEWISDKAIEVWGDIENYGRNLWKKVKAGASGLWKDLVAFASPYWDQLSAYATGIMEDIGDSLHIALIKALQGFADILLNLMSGPLAPLMKLAGLETPGEKINQLIFGGAVKNIEEAREARHRGPALGGTVGGAVAGGGPGGGDFGGDEGAGLDQMEGEGAALERGLDRDAKRRKRVANQAERDRARQDKDQMDDMVDAFQKGFTQDALNNVNKTPIQPSPFRFGFDTFEGFAKKLQESINPQQGGDIQKQVVENQGKQLAKQEDANQKLNDINAAIQNWGNGLVAVFS